MAVWACVLSIAAAFGKESGTTNWLTGKAFDAQLAQPTDLVVANRPLGTVLAHFAESQRLAIWLDRRVDPEQLLALSMTAKPARSVLEQVAAIEQLGMSIMGPVIYIGPADAAAKLRTLAHLRSEELKAVPAARRKAFAEVRTWHWNDLATPSELLESLAAQAHVELVGMDKVPHDLWAGRSLPALTWSDRLTLMALGFNLTWQPSADGKRVALVSVPERVVASRDFPAGSDGGETARLWARQFPQADVRLEGQRIVVKGHIEDLEAIVGETTSRSTKTKTKTTTPGKQLFKLTTEKPLSNLLSELGSRLELDFQLDRPAIDAAGISLEQIVSVKVEDASLDELIDAVLTPAGLVGKRQGRTVTVRPAKPAR